MTESTEYNVSAVEIAVMLYCLVDKKKMTCSWASEVTRWVKVLATDPDNLTLVTRTHMVEGENGIQDDFSCPRIQVHAMACPVPPRPPVYKM